MDDGFKYMLRERSKFLTQHGETLSNNIIGDQLLEAISVAKTMGHSLYVAQVLLSGVICQDAIEEAVNVRQDKNREGNNRHHKSH